MVAEHEAPSKARLRGLWIDHRKPYRAVWNELGIVLHAAAGFFEVLFGGVICLVALVKRDSALARDRLVDAPEPGMGVLLIGVFLTLMGAWSLALMVQLTRRQVRHFRGHRRAQ